MKSQKEKASYAIGLDMGNSLKKNEIEVDADVLIRGIKDALTGSKAAMTDQEIKDTIIALRKTCRQNSRNEMKTAGEKNKKEGEAFLAENKKKEGVITLPSGLQYKILKKGPGSLRKPLIP